MAIAKLTIVGLSSYVDDLWNGLTLPEGLNKEVAISSIINTCGEFPLQYPDGEYMKNMIRIWSIKWQRTFERWSLVETVDYNPLYNVDAQIEIKDTYNGTTDGTLEGNTNATTKISAFDSSDFQNRDQLIGTNGNVTHNTIHNENIHTEDRHGNIGVTKSTELLLSEVDARKWNVYNEIAHLFCNEFCIPVYD